MRGHCLISGECPAGTCQVRGGPTTYQDGDRAGEDVPGPDGRQHLWMNCRADILERLRGKYGMTVDEVLRQC